MATILTLEQQRAQWTYQEVFDITDKEGQLQLSGSLRQQVAADFLDERMMFSKNESDKESLYLCSTAYMKQHFSQQHLSLNGGLDISQSPYWLIGTIDTIKPIYDKDSLIAAMPKDWSIQEIGRMSPHAWQEFLRADLVKHINRASEEPTCRYAIYDSSAEVTFQFPTARETIAKADGLGFSRCEYIKANGLRKQITKFDGQWYVRSRESYPPRTTPSPPTWEDEPLAKVQEYIDRDAMYYINWRAKQRTEIEIGIDAATDRQMAYVDAYAFQRIEDTSLQKCAAAVIAGNARRYPEYKIGLDKIVTANPPVYEKMYALITAAEKQTVTHTHEIASAFAAALITDKAGNPAQREVLQKAVDAELRERAKKGKIPNVPVYDKSAPAKTHGCACPQTKRDTERTR
jgi:hypothetical protein